MQQRRGQARGLFPRHRQSCPDSARAHKNRACSPPSIDRRARAGTGPPALWNGGRCLPQRPPFFCHRGDCSRGARVFALFALEWMGVSPVLKKYAMPLGIWLLFAAIAVGLWLGLKNIFYPLQFSLYRHGVPQAWRCLRRERSGRATPCSGWWGCVARIPRRIRRENMQIEGFWYYLFLGVFEAATIHYAVAKIFGPLIFGAAFAATPAGRRWCSICCPSSAGGAAAALEGCALYCLCRFAAVCFGAVLVWRAWQGGNHVVRLWRQRPLSLCWPLSVGAIAPFASASARRRCFCACAWTRPPASSALCPMGLAIGDPQSGERTPRTVFSACAAWRNARKRH